jgi:hypothetical protein
VLSEPGRELLVLLLGVLLVEDAVTLVMHEGAAKTVFARLHIPAVQEIAAIHVSPKAEKEMVAVLPANRAFIGLLQVRAVLIHIMDVLCPKNDLVAGLPVFDIFAIIAPEGIFAVVEMVAGAILQIVSLIFFERVLQLQLSPACFQ